MSDHTLKLAEAGGGESAATESAEAALAELRQKRAAIAERRAKREDDLTLQLAEETQALADEEAIEQCELEHGPLGKKIAFVKTPLGVIVLKQSNALKFKRYQDKGSAEYADLDLLVRPCVVYPTLARFDEIMRELPFTMTRCANQVSVLAGVRVEELKGK
jgi:hypothetical protein